MLSALLASLANPSLEGQTLVVALRSAPVNAASSHGVCTCILHLCAEQHAACNKTCRPCQAFDEAAPCLRARHMPCDCLTQVRSPPDRSRHGGAGGRFGTPAAQLRGGREPGGPRRAHAAPSRHAEFRSQARVLRVKLARVCNGPLCAAHLHVILRRSFEAGHLASVRMQHSREWTRHNDASEPRGCLTACCIEGHCTYM